MVSQKILLALAMLAGLILAACTSSNTTIDMLNNTGWILENLNGSSVVADTQVTINFQDGTISGSDGCNSYSGTFTLVGSKFTVSEDIISTLMACDESIMQQGTAFYEALVAADSIEIDGQKLMLLDASGGTLAVFTQQGA